MSFCYLLDKIRDAEFSTEPFRFLQVKDFFSTEHFSEIISAREIALKECRNDDELFSVLFENGYKIIDFPGCIVDKKAYIEWHSSKELRRVTSTSCEGFGVTLRLYSAKSQIIADLMEFMGSPDFQQRLAEKFGIDCSEVTYDQGIQKYLDGYEISPHPDIRKKALTFMVNINPGRESEHDEHHTHLLRFKDTFKYVQCYWAGHPEADRCWVPWHWCDTEYIQALNNSIVVFAPSNSTLHAVKAKYDHLTRQRTQLYGNLWFGESLTTSRPEWEDLVISVRAETKKKRSVLATLKDLVPAPVKKVLKGTSKDDGNIVYNRMKT